MFITTYYELKRHLRNSDGPDRAWAYHGQKVPNGDLAELRLFHSNLHMNDLKGFISHSHHPDSGMVIPLEKLPQPEKPVTPDVVCGVWASDVRKLGITLKSGISMADFNAAQARIYRELERVGNYAIENAVITLTIREGVIDLVAEWEGFISPDAEKLPPAWDGK